jgi:hypothetical protein
MKKILMSDEAYGVQSLSIEEQRTVSGGFVKAFLIIAGVVSAANGVYEA